MATAGAVFQTIIALCDEISRARSLTESETDALEYAMKRTEPCRKIKKRWTGSEDRKLMALASNYHRHGGKWDQPEFSVSAAKALKRSRRAVQCRLRQIRVSDGGGKQG